MNYKEFVDKIKPEVDKAMKFLEGELAKIRTSRASPSLVEDVEVSAFGSKFPLKQLGAISCPQTNQIVIQPWDKSYLEPIEKAIASAGLGMSAVVDKDILRLSLPLLTDEYRQNLAKIMNEKAESTRQTIRRHRDEAWSKIQDACRAKTISEDEKFKGKDSLQKIVDEAQEKIENLIERKKQELS